MKLLDVIVPYPLSSHFADARIEKNILSSVYWASAKSNPKIRWHIRMRNNNPKKKKRKTQSMLTTNTMNNNNIHMSNKKMWWQFPVRILIRGRSYSDEFLAFLFRCCHSNGCQMPESQVQLCACNVHKNVAIVCHRQTHKTFMGDSYLKNDNTDRRYQRNAYIWRHVAISPTLTNSSSPTPVDAVLLLLWP